MTAAERLAADSPRPRPVHDPKAPRRRTLAATGWQTYQRLIYVERMLAAGATTREVIDWATRKIPGKKDWAVTERVAQRWMERVRGYWLEEEEDRRPARRREMRVKLEMVHRTAMEKGKFDAAARALDLLCKMDGLYEPERLAITVAKEDERDVAERVRHYRSTLDLIADGPNGAGGGNGSAEPTRH
jgi:hypothetical protein